MEKLELDRMENSRFDKADVLHGEVEKILTGCGEFKDLEEYSLIKGKLIDVLTLLNKLRTDSLKNPPQPD